MTFQYHPEVAKELTTSIQYYEDKSVGLGAEFLDEIEGFYLTDFLMKLFMTFLNLLSQFLLSSI